MRKIKTIFTLMLVAIMLATLTSSCTNTEISAAPNAQNGMSTGADDTTQPYEFTVYANYEWFTVREWGADASSKYIADKFNVNIIWEKPNTDASTKLNLMAATGNYPEVIYMDKDADYKKLVAENHLLPLDTYMYEGNDFEANTFESTIDLSRVDGKVYMITNWSRMEATGGNNAWIINQSAWEAAGSPDLNTLEDIYDYLMVFKELDFVNHRGESVFPMLTIENDDASLILEAFNRSYGGPNPVADWYGISTGEIKFFLEDPIMLQALETANKWFNDGLISQSVFTDTREQSLEKITTGRGAILYYDFSQDQSNRFRKILIESSENTNSYEVLVDPIYPPASGVDYTYGDESSTLGTSGMVITKNAENPQRIFDVFSWMLTQEGAINMMYSAQGAGMWDELDENGNPILLKSENAFTSSELNELGAWFWAYPAQADHVDRTKFAVNATLAPSEQDFTTSLQANFFSAPAGTQLGDTVASGQKYITDEHVGIIPSIDPTTELGISRQLIEDEIAKILPQIVMAENSEDYDTLVEHLIDYAYDNSMDEILEKYNQTRDENIKAQGWSYYD